MSTYIFDVHGTLVGNPEVTDEDVRKMLLLVRTAGHHIVLMSAEIALIPESLIALADDCLSKPVRFQDYEDVVVFDDDALLLRTAARLGAKVVHASQMCAWLDNEDWGNGRRQIPCA
jgi:hypothetical protein